MKRRVILAFSLILLLLAAVTGRLFQLQILQHGYWLARATSIQERELTRAYPRGDVYDRNGLLLATDIRTRSIAIDTHHMAKPQALKSILKRNLNLSEDFLQERFSRESYFTWIERKVDLATADRIERQAKEAGAKGLVFVDEWQRTYPQGKLASNVLGFAGLDDQGLEGLELGFEELLRGKAERSLLIRGGDGAVVAKQVLEPGRPGADLVLTIDARIQHLAEEKIGWGVDRFEAQNGFITVMDPYTGELLAMAQASGFDPNEFRRSTSEERLNYAISWPFEPGSVLKIFNTLAALEYGIISPQERINGNQPVVVGGHRFHNAEQVSYGTVTLEDVIVKSINTGMIRVALRLGKERLYSFLGKLGFGRETGLKLPGEVSGTLRPVSEWSKLALGAIPIGQSISVTGIQLIRAGAAIANGGKLLQPQIIKEARRSDGSVEEFKPQAIRKVASPWNIELLREMMEEVVGRGTGRWAQIEGFSIAAKSGTAEKAVPGEGYVEGKYVSSFLGFFPATDPQFIILVVLDEVGTEPYWGGFTSGKVFKELAERLIDLENLRPDR